MPSAGTRLAVWPPINGPSEQQKGGIAVATQVDRQPSSGAPDVAQQAKQTTSELADKAKQTGERQLTSRKDQAAQSATNLADAMRQVGDRMEQQGQEQGTAQLVSAGADQIDKIANYLRDTDINEIVGGVEDFARRQPALFLGGAFALGLIGARFLKAGAQSRQEQRDGQRWAGNGSRYGSYQDRYGGFGPGSRTDVWAEPVDAVPSYDQYAESGRRV